MAVQDLTRIEDKLDKSIAGAVPISDAIGGVLFSNMAEVMEFAKLLSLAGTAVPKHLRGNPGGCLAVTIQALEWRMSPVAVANQSYEVNDRIAYQSMLIHAVVEARAPLKGRLRPEYEGEGESRACIIRGHIKGELDPLEYRSPKKSDIKIQNSPLWKSDPDQQLFYYASRAWARRYCPDVLLGIYSEEELRDSEPMKDVTPKPDVAARLKGSKGKRGFSHEGVTQALEHKPQEAINTVPAEGGKQPEPVAADSGTAAKDRANQQTLETTEKSQHADEPEPLIRGRRLLGKCKTPADVKDLRQTIAEELSGDDLQQWSAACDVRDADFGRKDSAD